MINLIKDWSRHEAERREGYPPTDIYIQDIPIWSDQKIESFVKERIRLHEEAANGNAILCTDDERWLRDEKFAVNKEGRKRAVRVFDSQQEAETFITALADADKHSVEHRKGSNTRCEQFCDVSEFCLQFQSLRSASQHD